MVKSAKRELNFGVKSDCVLKTHPSLGAKMVYLYLEFGMTLPWLPQCALGANDMEDSFVLYRRFCKLYMIHPQYCHVRTVGIWTSLTITITRNVHVCHLSVAHFKS